MSRPYFQNVLAALSNSIARKWFEILENFHLNDKIFFSFSLQFTCRNIVWKCQSYLSDVIGLIYRFIFYFFLPQCFVDRLSLSQIAKDFRFITDFMSGWRIEFFFKLILTHFNDCRCYNHLSSYSSLK